jgi:hypothetical protein
LSLPRHHAARVFVRTPAEGVGTNAAACYARPVIVRRSDFKTKQRASFARTITVAREAEPAVPAAG